MEGYKIEIKHITDGGTFLCESNGKQIDYTIMIESRELKFTKHFDHFCCSFFSGNGDNVIFLFYYFPRNSATTALTVPDDYSFRNDSNRTSSSYQIQINAPPKPNETELNASTNCTDCDKRNTMTRTTAKSKRWTSNNS